MKSVVRSGGLFTTAAFMFTVCLSIGAINSYNLAGFENSSNSINIKESGTCKKNLDTTFESDTVIMETSMGDITIELYPNDAPLHVANFKDLVRSQFYEGLAFHRVIPGFMIQGGDPNTRGDDRNSHGSGGPGYTIPAEIKRKHEYGSLAAARLGDAMNPKRESSGSQFYIVTGEASFLDGAYTVYGKVISGMDIAIMIQNVKRDGRDDPIDRVEIRKVYFAR